MQNHKSLSLTESPGDPIFWHGSLAMSELILGHQLLDSKSAFWGHFGTYLDKYYPPCHWTWHETYISGIHEDCPFLWIYSNVQGTPQELQGVLFILYKWKKVDPVHHVCIQQKLGNGASREHCDSVLHFWKRSEFHSLLIINVKFTMISRLCLVQ